MKNELNKASRGRKTRTGRRVIPNSRYQDDPVNGKGVVSQLERETQSPDVEHWPAHENQWQDLGSGKAGKLCCSPVSDSQSATSCCDGSSVVDHHGLATGGSLYRERGDVSTEADVADILLEMFHAGDHYSSKCLSLAEGTSASAQRECSPGAQEPLCRKRARARYQKGVVKDEPQAAAGSSQRGEAVEKAQSRRKRRGVLVEDTSSGFSRKGEAERQSAGSPGGDHMCGLCGSSTTVQWRHPSDEILEFRRDHPEPNVPCPTRNDWWCNRCWCKQYSSWKMARHAKEKLASAEGLEENNSRGMQQAVECSRDAGAEVREQKAPHAQTASTRAAAVAAAAAEAEEQAQQQPESRDARHQEAAPQPEAVQQLQPAAAGAAVAVQALPQAPPPATWQPSGGVPPATAAIAGAARAAAACPPFLPAALPPPPLLPQSIASLRAPRPPLPLLAGTPAVGAGSCAAAWMGGQMLSWMAAQQARVVQQAKLFSGGVVTGQELPPAEAADAQQHLPSPPNSPDRADADLAEHGGRAVAVAAAAAAAAAAAGHRGLVLGMPVMGMLPCPHFPVQGESLDVRSWIEGSGTKQHPAVASAGMLLGMLPPL